MNAVKSEDGVEAARLEMPASQRRVSRSQDIGIKYKKAANGFGVSSESESVYRAA